MDTKKYQKILKIVLIFVLLQPIFDILSRLAILGYIPNISTYLKPLFVFGMTTYLLLHYSPKRISWLTYISIFIILIIGHTYLLYTLLIDKNVIFHELRFMINILYMISIFIIFDTLNYYTNDKKEMYRKIKKTIFATLIIYMILYIVAIITHTSGLTYEISDVNKLGYKGWYDSGQILGHAYSVVLPLITYIALDPKKKWYLRVLSILLFILTASLLGTRVPYFITIIVFILYLIVTILTKILNKYHKINYFNVIYIVGCIITLIAIYPFTPVKKNMDINNTSKSTSINKYDLKQESGYYNILNEEALNEKYPNQNIKPLIEYNLWSRASSEYLIKLFEGNELHPSNMRYKQIIYANQKYKLSSIKYKIFGLGFLNQDTSLAIESDLQWPCIHLEF